ncbi:chromosome partition protein Smc [Candidatus Scalindua japonica]|uniref:Chromosome partition protein Smc n=1 Tax=Candidatus Scalindua japonica TaxID=1284222 RepID=A0A286U072_9BACT|nr:hypothetical protein [Candidatus Scalindua japonica]GAX61461.1 chromosome partition protein Smc [Candidatus Scalindua japonica]
MIAITFNRTYDTYAAMINGIFQHCVVVFAGKHPGSKDEEVYKAAILTALDDFTKQNNDMLQKHKKGIFADLAKYHEDGANLKEEVGTVEELIKITINKMADGFWRQDLQADDS